MWKIFKNLTKKELGFAFLALVFIVLQVWLDLTLPDYMSEITTYVQTPGSAMSDIGLQEEKCFFAPSAVLLPQ